MTKFHLFILAIIALSFADAARAEEIDCWNTDKTFYNCNSGSSGAAVGASAPLLGDTMEANPAALPTETTPFGIEGIFSDRAWPNGKPKVSVSTVKGFDGIGFGIGSWSDGTFSAPDFFPHFANTSAEPAYLAYERSPPSVLGIRLGTSILLPKGPLPKSVRFSVGGSGGLGRVSGDWSPQVGILMRVYGIGIGYSENFERLARSLPRTRISNFSVGIQLWHLYLGYSRAAIRSDVNRTYSDSVSVRVTSGLWTAHGALKLQTDHHGLPDSWASGGIQRRLGKSFGAGYEYGYYRLSHSLTLQFFL